MIAPEWGIPLILLLFAFNLGLAVTRVSLLNARPLRLLSLREGQPEAVDRTLSLLENPRLRATLRLSQILTRFLLAGFILLLVQSRVNDPPASLAVQLGSLLLAALVLLVVEFAVEWQVLAEAERWALRLTPVGRFLVALFTPLVILPLFLLRSQGTPPVPAQMTEDELKTWVESDEEAGSLERDERQMIYSIFQFGETLAREIMVPRIDVLALDVNTSLSDAVQAFTGSGYSRVPVYEATVDNVIGLLYAKDLLQSMNGGSSKKVSLRDLLRPAYFVPETKKVDDLLAEMQAQRIHMAVIVDEYGGVAGLVTLEDIVEEIIGEIHDEYDQSEELLYQAVGPDEYVFQGRIDLDDFNQVMGSHLPKVESDTLAGYLYAETGRVPQGGETLGVAGLLLTIEQVTGRRIRRVRARRISAGETEIGEKHDG
jgi:putative hemolysin